jgi:hypothetical protein
MTRQQMLDLNLVDVLHLSLRHGADPNLLYAVWGEVYPAVEIAKRFDTWGQENGLKPKRVHGASLAVRAQNFSNTIKSRWPQSEMSRSTVTGTNYLCASSSLIQASYPVGSDYCGPT